MRLWEFLERQITLRFLSRRWASLRTQFPQVYCAAFDYVSLYINVDGRYDREELAFLCERLSGHIAGRTVVDVGANIGNHALAFAQSAGKVIALEPHPVIYQLLLLNCRVRANVVPKMIGASDAAATVVAVTPAGNLGQTSIGRSAEEGTAVEIQVAPIDQMPDLLDVGLIKLDVEGHEEQALRGAEQLLRRERPVVMLEQNADVIKAGTSPSVEFLKELGYAHFYSVETRLPWRASLPGILRRFGHAVEGLVFGVPDKEAYARPVEWLEARHYPCLIASAHGLPELLETR